MGCHVGLSGLKKKIAPTYFCDFLSANKSLGKSFISLILMLMLSLSVAAWLRASLGVPACLELFSCCCWVISFASVCLSDLFFCAAYNWHPVILSKLYENKMYCSLEGEQLLDPCVFSTCSFWNTFFFNGKLNFNKGWSLMSPIVMMSA